MSRLRYLQGRFPKDKIGLNLMRARYQEATFDSLVSGKRSLSVDEFFIFSVIRTSFILQVSYHIHLSIILKKLMDRDTNYSELHNFEFV